MQGASQEADILAWKDLPGNIWMQEPIAAWSQAKNSRAELAWSLSGLGRHVLLPSFWSCPPSNHPTLLNGGSPKGQGYAAAQLGASYWIDQHLLLESTIFGIYRGTHICVCLCMGTYLYMHTRTESTSRHQSYQLERTGRIRLSTAVYVQVSFCMYGGVLCPP